MKSMHHTFLILFITIALFPGIIHAQEKTARKPKIGLVLSGGGAKGLAHIGVLKVLEEAGIHVDYIAGTSMGSIVGGLYAIGYNASELEKIVQDQNWITLLNDEINRKSLPVDEKDELGKYIVTFPVKNLRPTLPGGMKEGQNISILLSRLTWAVKDVNDLNRFPIPFRCIAADIVTGNEVVLDKGYLPDALRASMAIPTIFTPVEWEDKLLVDGGIINNFPVDRVKEMGADIIIGVDLGFRPNKKDELHSLSAIMEQAVLFRANEKNMQNVKLVDILIEPDAVAGYNIADFKQSKNLIALGELAARKHWDQLKSLADSLNTSVPFTSPAVTVAPDSIFISQVEFSGLKNVSESFVLGKLRLKIPGTVRIYDIESAIDRLYGSQFFEKALYKIVHRENSNFLELRLVERNYDLLRLGARYDSDFNSYLLINSTFRNLLLKGTKLSFDFVLGQYSKAKVTYTVHSGWGSPFGKSWFEPSGTGIGILPDMELASEIDNFEIYQYKNSTRTSVLQYTQSKVSLGFRSNISNSFLAGIGAITEFSAIRFKVSSSDPPPSAAYNSFLNIYGTARIDNADHVTYPTHGMKLFSRIEYVSSLSESDLYGSFTRLINRLDVAFPAGNKFTIRPFLYTGLVVGDSIPPEYSIFCGGLNYSSVNPGFFPFLGRRLHEEMGKSAWVTGLNFQYQFLPNHYLCLAGNLGQVAPNPRQWIRSSTLLSGLGLSYGYDSILGPIELTVMTPTDKSGLLYFINIGFWF
ncbi:MAG: patatin-like phospholipase family protein [Bacteroidales bacterium]